MCFQQMLAKDIEGLEGACSRVDLGSMFLEVRV